MNTTDRFVEHLYQLSCTPVSVETNQICRLKLLDYLGVTIAGSTLMSEQIARYPGLSEQMLQGFVPVLGTGKFTSFESAALLNAMSAHTAELDDGDRFGMVHPGAPVISALLSALHYYQFDTNQFIKGILVGYEAAISLARLLQPELKDNGYHATGPCGCVGAAMAVATALDFNRLQMKSAFTAAVTGASGILQVIRGHSQLKPYNAGQAALNGLNAAIMVKLGFCGPDDVMEGSQGFVRMMTGIEQIKQQEMFTEPLIYRTYSKPYAACRHCHAPVEAALLLRQEYAITFEQICSIKVITHRFAVYKHDHTVIENTHSAKMSIPYSVAAALITGQAGLEAFSETCVNDKNILELTSLIRVEVDDALTAMVPHKRTAIVELELVDGKVVTHQVDLPLGEPENPMSPDMLLDKFYDLAAYSGIEKADFERLATDILVNPDLLVALRELHRLAEH